MSSISALKAMEAKKSMMKRGVTMKNTMNLSMEALKRSQMMQIKILHHDIHHNLYHNHSSFKDLVLPLTSASLNIFKI